MQAVSFTNCCWYCFIQLGRPQRRLCRQVLFLSVEQCSCCWTPSGDESVPDHCCMPAQNRRGSLDSGVCGLWTSPVPAWTGFCTRRAASVAPSGLVVRGHATTIPEVNVRRRSGGAIGKPVNGSDLHSQWMNLMECIGDSPYGTSKALMISDLCCFPFWLINT